MDKVYEEVSVDNPAGIITDELIKTLCEAFASEKPLRIFVRGEEDLATLPVILAGSSWSCGPVRTAR